MDAQAAGVTNDFELLARCRAGDEPAWRALYDAHFDFVYRVARRFGTPDSEMDDVCQETFLVAFRKLASFRGGRFTTWLYRVAANVTSDRHRRRRFRRALAGLWSAQKPADVPAPAADRAIEAREARVHVERILERMAPKKREVFVLFEIEGLSGEEIAERIDCQPGTVWTRLHHARREFERLARRLGEVT